MKETAAAPAAAELRTIPIGQLRVMAGNPRKEFGNGDLEDLAASIRLDGILEPLLVREYSDPENPNADGFEIVAGERRYRAGKLAKLTEVPCIIRAMDDAQAREIRLIENLQRRDLSELEEAAAFQDCLNGGTYGDKVPLREDEFGPTDPAKRVKVKGAVEAFAKKVGKSAKFVYDRLKLLELAAPAAKALESGQITAGHAIEIARRPVGQQKLLVDETLDANLTVRQLRDQIRDDEQREEEEAKRKEEKPKKHRGAKGESAAAKAKALKQQARRQEDEEKRVQNRERDRKVRGRLFVAAIKALRKKGLEQKHWGYIASDSLPWEMTEYFADAVGFGTGKSKTGAMEAASKANAELAGVIIIASKLSSGILWANATLQKFVAKYVPKAEQRAIAKAVIAEMKPAKAANAVKSKGKAKAKKRVKK